LLNIQTYYQTYYQTYPDISRLQLISSNNIKHPDIQLVDPKEKGGPQELTRKCATEKSLGCRR